MSKPTSRASLVCFDFCRCNVVSSHPCTLATFEGRLEWCGGQVMRCFSGIHGPIVPLHHGSLLLCHHRTHIIQGQCWTLKKLPDLWFALGVGAGWSTSRFDSLLLVRLESTSRWIVAASFPTEQCGVVGAEKRHALPLNQDVDA